MVLPLLPKQETRVRFPSPAPTQASNVDSPMIKRLFVQITESISLVATTDSDVADREAALRLATAVLMIDVARADHVFEESEFDRVLQLIESHFALTPEQSATLVNVANDEADDMVSLYEFTQILHKHLDHDEKAKIISLLWKVAYADGRLDKYEDSLVLKISDLLYVSRGRVMRLKHDAQQSVTP
jgi:uncharacterized tellurite resistance protein B-like protein